MPILLFSGNGREGGLILSKTKAQVKMNLFALCLNSPFTPFWTFKSVLSTFKLLNANTVQWRKFVFSKDLFCCHHDK